MKYSEIPIGVCKRCKKEPIDYGYSKVHCFDCYLKRREYEKINKENIKKNRNIKRSPLAKESLQKGLCVHCFKREITKERSSKYCEHCLDKRKQANQRYNKLHRKENYERSIDWAKRNPDKKAEQTRRHRQKHKEHYASVNKAYKKTEKYKLKSAEYREKNREKVNQVSLEWQKRNPERRKQNVKNWLARNPGKSHEYAKRYQQKHPEQVTKSSRKRRELFKKVEGNFNLKEWLDLCEKFQNRCLWCGKVGIKLTVDHVVPVSKGGSNYISNIQPLCSRCNSKKNKKILDFRPFGNAILDWT